MLVLRGRYLIMICRAVNIKCYLKINLVRNRGLSPFGDNPPSERKVNYFFYKYWQKHEVSCRCLPEIRTTTSAPFFFSFFQQLCTRIARSDLACRKWYPLLILGLHFGEISLDKISAENAFAVKTMLHLPLKLHISYFNLHCLTCYHHALVLT